MISIKEKNMCSGCGACVSICPKQCISMRNDEEGFWYPSVDGAKCIQCKMCITTCPERIIENSEEAKVKDMPLAYAAYIEDEVARKKSTSGGVFIPIAKYVLNQKGIVFGAAFSNDYKQVNHVGITSLDELEKLQGSKYLQSNVGNTFTETKAFLNQGRWVLYTGTPCQIEGLKSFLGKDYEKLICVDFICHGVPSPLVWKLYANAMEKKKKSKLNGVSFRNKDAGWNLLFMKMVMKMTNGRIYKKAYLGDAYIKAFQSNICLRPSCYGCNYKKINRKSDITLADFWGINGIAPEMDDGKGTSLVIIHSEKGKNIWLILESEVKTKEVDFLSAIASNTSMIESAKEHPNRNDFMKLVSEENFDKIVLKYVNDNRTFHNYYLPKIKKMVKKVLIR